jgi:biopolymer transport protein ExbB/TolQ
MLFYLLTEAIALAEEAEKAPGFTMGEIWEHSGWLARGVIITLVVPMMGGGILTTIERLIAFRRARTQSVRLASQIIGPLQANDVHGALKVAQSEDYKASYLGALLKAGLRELAVRQDRDGVDNARRAVEKARAEEHAKLKRGMPILATIGSTAPFVGLFGTTFGVINAFAGMASEGSGLSSISAGISEALITTGVGILVAVLGVWAYNFFTNRIEKVSDELGSSESDFLDWAEKLIQTRTESGK